MGHSKSWIWKQEKNWGSLHTFWPQKGLRHPNPKKLPLIRNICLKKEKNSEIRSNFFIMAHFKTWIWERKKIWGDLRTFGLKMVWNTHFCQKLFQIGWIHNNLLKYEHNPLIKSNSLTVGHSKSWIWKQEKNWSSLHTFWPQKGLRQKKSRKTAPNQLGTGTFA